MITGGNWLLILGVGRTKPHPTGKKIPVLGFYGRARRIRYSVSHALPLACTHAGTMPVAQPSFEQRRGRSGHPLSNEPPAREILERLLPVLVGAVVAKPAAALSLFALAEAGLRAVARGPGCPDRIIDLE